MRSLPQREDHCKRRSLALPARHFHPAPMSGDDLMRQRKPHTDSFVLGREERQKDLFYCLGSYPLPRIADGDPQFVVRAVTDLNESVPSPGMASTAFWITLVNACRINTSSSEASMASSWQVRFDPGSCAGCLLDVRKTVLDQFPDIDVHPVQRCRPRKGQEVADDPVHAVDLDRNTIDELLPRGIRVFRQQIEIAGHDRHGVPEFMGNAGGHLAERFQALLKLYLFLKTFDLGKVGE